MQKRKRYAKYFWSGEVNTGFCVRGPSLERLYRVCLWQPEHIKNVSSYKVTNVIRI